MESRIGRMSLQSPRRVEAMDGQNQIELPLR